ncbi:MAG: DNA-3-methyladenine glycosylase, partial [Bacteroidales bacterium]
NVVTNQMNQPHAVLIRGIIPESCQPLMLERSGKSTWNETMMNGPGKVSMLLGIHYRNSGMDLTNPAIDSKIPAIWLEDTRQTVSGDMIEITPRIGVDYAGEDAALPYRFILKKKGSPLSCLSSHGE